MADHRTEFLKASWINVITNVLKIVVEGGLGLAFGSLALVADAAHSVADLLASAVVLVWGRLSFEDPDENHPHGHERVEPLTALFVGGMLILLGLQLLADAWQTILSTPESHYSIYLVAALGFAFADRYFCYWYTKRVNREVQSPGLSALVADSKNDLYTTGAAVVGVAGMAGGYPILDPIAGGLVSLLVINQGIEVSRENVDYLIDSAAPEHVRENLRNEIRTHDDVHGVHDFTVYHAGTVYEVEFHAEVSADHSFVEAHDIETDLRNALMSRDEVGDVHIHLDPAGMGEWKDADEKRVSSSAN
ncbi:cation diffusion facilitator family transporter [Haladaptatus pallidirubidus]|uniref:Cation diffusion facilitator family transporter n=1 Tax=Haladaptatus pallidirubidus TaxID=1008152 RepID=A0AAV3UCY9_9EURY|nr:cation diffusion facilitator family transporter [Haladaptatus pallidirubidus]